MTKKKVLCNLISMKLGLKEKQQRIFKLKIISFYRINFFYSFVFLFFLFLLNLKYTRNLLNLLTNYENKSEF